MTRDTDVVVIGSGGFGAATAYFLTRRSGRRVALLDRHSLASQTSPRAAGNAAVLRSTEPMTRLASRAVEWLLRFSADTGQPLEIVQSGSLKAAPSRQRAPQKCGSTDPNPERLRRRPPHQFSPARRSLTL